MYGWRGRIGLMIPSSNTTMEEEFRRLLPDGVSLHTARMRLKKATVDELENMEKYMDEAANELADAKVDILVFGCTTGSLIKGYGYDLKLNSRMTEITGIPSVTTATAVIEALRELDINSVCIATPYIKELDEREKKFLEDNGFNVINIKGLGIVDNIEIGKLDPLVAYRLAKEVYNPKCDGIFISCTNFRTIEIIEKLELDIGKPVISSNQATFWAALKRLKIKDKIENYGSLLRRL